MFDELKNDNEALWIGDGNHAGTTVWRCPHHRAYFFADHTNRKVHRADRVFGVRLNDLDLDSVYFGPDAAFDLEAGLALIGDEMEVTADDWRAHLPEVEILFDSGMEAPWD
jgi:hypothetical protein